MNFVTHEMTREKVDSLKRSIADNRIRMAKLTSDINHLQSQIDALISTRRILKQDNVSMIGVLKQNGVECP